MSTRDIDATAARRAIDEEIVLHEATIRSLKTRRNTYSSTSALPSEILAKIFLAAKSGVPRYGTPKEASWLNVAGVCQEWRNIVLTSPRMWSSIELSRPDRALELLKRSKSVPLQISCRMVPLVIAAGNEDMAKSIMAEVGRIQELDISTTVQDEILRFLRFNGTTSAPLLEHLRLVALQSLSAANSAPLDILHREMPSLRRLDLQYINISELPPFPHLTSLKLSFGTWSTMRPSSLLSSLQHSPKLEEIVITGMVKNDPADSPMHVKLPNLSHISITANDLEASSIFANLEYPHSATVAFTSRMAPAGELDLSNLVKLCGRSLEPDAPIIHRVQFNGWRFEGPFRLDISGQEPLSPKKLSVTLELEHRYYSAAFVTLCSALPLESVPILGVGGFNEMTHAQWTTIFGRCKRIQHLHFNDVNLSLFRALIKPSKSKPKSPRLLPKLQAIHLIQCTLIDPENRYAEAEASSSFDIFEKFLKQRKRFKVPVHNVTIEMCQITEDAVAKLEQHTEVDWDGDEMDSEEDEDEEDYFDSDDFDDMYGFAEF